MYLRRVSESDIITAAADAGVRLDGLRVCGSTGFRVRLKTEGRPPRWGRRGFRRRRDGERVRIPGAVCWHGHRAFMRALYERAPDAVILTGLRREGRVRGPVRYNGREHFEQTHRETGRVNVGSQHDPMRYDEMCDCEEDVPEVMMTPTWYEERTVTPEETATRYEPDPPSGERWAQLNRRFAALFSRPACDCEWCPPCSAWTVCARCKQCARHASHAPGCPGC